MSPKSLKRGFAFFFLALGLFAAPAAAEELEFSEVWAYLMDGEERFFDPAYPITDLAYFGAGINSAGKLVGVPDRGKLGAFRGRTHFVVAELGNYALSHFCLTPEYQLRDALLADIVKAAEDYDGVQIDFEAVASRDRDAFYAFLCLLKEGLGEKTLSVALPACTLQKYDSFGYERIGKAVDRVIVMAYDEHWSESAPGPVASMDWCRKVAAYAVSKVAPEKLVMGAPFYGRAWADKDLSRAYKYSSLSSLMEEKGIEEVRRDGEVPYLEYSESVKVKVFFDDSTSTLARLKMYRSSSVRNIAFWRLGQEDKAIWQSLTIDPALAAPAPSPCRRGGRRLVDSVAR
jgi:spore germination protein YaaH